MMRVLKLPPQIQAVARQVRTHLLLQPVKALPKPAGASGIHIHILRLDYIRPPGGYQSLCCFLHRSLLSMPSRSENPPPCSDTHSTKLRCGPCLSGKPSLQRTMPHQEQIPGLRKGECRVSKAISSIAATARHCRLFFFGGGRGPIGPPPGPTPLSFYSLL